MNSKSVISETVDSEAQEAIRRQVRENRICDRVKKGIPRARAEEAEAHGEECLAKNRESLISGIMEERACLREQAEEFIAGSTRRYWQDILNHYQKLKAKHPKRFAELELETKDAVLEVLVNLKFPPHEVAVAKAVTNAWLEEQSFKRGMREVKKRMAEATAYLAKTNPAGLKELETLYPDNFKTADNAPKPLITDH